MSTNSKKAFQRMTAREMRGTESEGSIQKAICDLLRTLGIPYSVTDAALIFDRSGGVIGRGVRTEGWVDITAVLPSGRFLGIEVKSPRGRLRPSQVRCHKILRDAGALVIVPRSLEEVARALLAAGVNDRTLIQLLGR